MAGGIEVEAGAGRLAQVELRQQDAFLVPDRSGEHLAQRRDDDTTSTAEHVREGGDLREGEKSAVRQSPQATTGRPLSARDGW